MRMRVFTIAVFVMASVPVSAEERKVEFEKIIQHGAKLMSITTYKGIKPLTKVCEAGCPTPLYRWTCNDNESCGINCAAKLTNGYCY